MINFNTDNLVIVYYPRGAGGKFLINCLGLSHTSLFQDAILAEKQIDGIFNLEDKMQYLIDQFSKITPDSGWNDLNLGCIQLTKISPENLLLLPTKLIKKYNLFDPRFKKISDSNFKFFMVAHYPLQLEKYLDIWPNAKIIIFKNNEDFINFRNNSKELERVWDIYKGDSWPRSYPGNLINLSENLIEEIKIKCPYLYYELSIDTANTIYYNQKIKRIKNSKLKNQIIFWDTNLYFSCDDTVNRIEQLYNELALTNFNREYIMKYYNLWINKLIQLK